MDIQQSIDRLIQQPEPRLYTDARILEILGIIAELDRKVESIIKVNELTSG